MDQLMVLKYEDLASQPSEQLAAIEERFNISLGSKEVLNHANAIMLLNHAKSHPEHERNNKIHHEINSNIGKWGNTLQRYYSDKEKN